MNLREIRENKGLSQKELAQLLGVSPTNIYNYEVGRTEPCVSVLINLAQILDVSVDYLVGNSDEFGNVSAAPMGDTLSKDEKDLLSAFNRLSVFERDSILVQIKALAEKNKSVIKK